MVLWSTLRAKHGVKPEEMASINASPAETQADVQIFMCRHSALLETLWAQPRCQTTGGIRAPYLSRFLQQTSTYFVHSHKHFTLRCQWDIFFHRIAEKTKIFCVLEQNNPQHDNADGTELKESLGPDIKVSPAFFLRSVRLELHPCTFTGLKLLSSLTELEMFCPSSVTHIRHV